MECSTKTPIAITGSTGNITLTGDITITGNLNVSGEYNSSTSNIVTYDDTFLRVNNGNASDVDAGLIAEKSSGDARIFWDASESYWTAGSGTFSQIIRLADATTDGDANPEKILKTTAGGNVKVTSATLGAVGSNISIRHIKCGVPTIGQVAESIKRWGGSYISDDSSNSVAGNRYIETTVPTSGQGADGDLWFVREA
jgi:hypothetical protein